MIDFESEFEQLNFIEAEQKVMIQTVCRLRRLDSFGWFDGDGSGRGAESHDGVHRRRGQQHPLARRLVVLPRRSRHSKRLRRLLDHVALDHVRQDRLDERFGQALVCRYK